VDKLNEWKEKINNTVFAKGKYTKEKLIIAIVVSFLISFILVIIKPVKIWDRLPIFMGVILFVSLHGIFKLDKMYEFIYKKRFYIALITLAYCTIMCYSGSSIGIYNHIIQGESSETYFSPILGQYRGIRSDEWSINGAICISQSLGDKEEQFSYYNDNLRGTRTDMLSIVNAPVKDIIMIGKPFNLAYFIFSAERAFAFVWSAKVIALILVTFEFCMLITNKNKLISLFGMIVIVFSAGVQWWWALEYFIWGMLALILIDKFMLAKKYKQKILYALGIFISGISYVFIFYPAWQLTFGYIFLAIFIWIFWKNRKEYKINLKDILIVILVILAIGGICLRYFTLSAESLELTMNTDYPGERFELGGDGAKVVFSYVYSILFPYVGIDNPCELAGMTSLFPIPLIITLIYMIRNKDRKKHMAFFIPLLFLTIIYSIFTFFETNELFAKITLLYMVPGRRLAIPLGFIQILLMLYVMSNIKKTDKLVNKDFAKILAVIFSVAIFSIAIRTCTADILGSLKSYICGMLLLAEIYLLLTINQEKSKKYFIMLLIPLSLLGGATIHPIQKGTSVLTEKPVAKKVQEIVQNNEQNNLWIVDNTNFFIPNYILASGAKVINSTNTYPNMELYKVVLGEEAEEPETKSIYNRYAHLNIEITLEESKIELLYQDSTKLYINTNKLDDLGVGYILSTRRLEEFSTEEIEIEKVYEEQGLYIYKLNY